MRKIIEKTEKEILREQTIEKISVRDLGRFYFVCSRCKIAYFGDDIILRVMRSEGYYDEKCPNKIEGLFAHICMKNIYGGNEDQFNYYYKFALDSQEK